MARTAPKTSTSNPNPEPPAPSPGGASGAPGAESALPPLAGVEPIGTAVQADDPPSPPVRRFLVLQDRNVMHRGCMVKIRAGKEIDELNYQIDHLVRQGVQLREVSPPEP